MHARAFTEMIEMGTDIVLENMPPNVAWFLEDGQTLTMLNREEIRNLDRDVRLLLTRARSAQSLQTNAQATQLVLQYIALPKASQKIVRPFFINQLRALDVQDADDHLPEVTDADIEAEKQAAAQSQGKPPSESMSLNYKDAPDPIKRQMEVALGMQPLSPEQEQQLAAVANIQEHTPVPVHHERPDQRAFA